MIFVINQNPNAKVLLIFLVNPTEENDINVVLSRVTEK
jgi:hypothetical protein